MAACYEVNACSDKFLVSSYLFQSLCLSSSISVSWSGEDKNLAIWYTNEWFGD